MPVRPTAAPPFPDPLPWLRRAILGRLANGMEVCLLPNRQADLVTTALFYRAGTRDEPAAHRGVAHFLEHLMFKGSPGFGPGEIDRLTQAAGGVNNAFTGHNLTAFYFAFGADRWRTALAVEADRMAALTLDPEAVASERQVILEELAMYEDEPWDALEMAVLAALFPGHPYGQPILGNPATLRATGAAELADFHRRFYGPDNAVLVVAGALRPEAGRWIEEAFAPLAARGTSRPELPPLPPLPGLVRVERHQGEAARLLLALPAPAVGSPEQGALRLALALLTAGRSSRLQQLLVEADPTCLVLSAELHDGSEAPYLTIAVELLPGVEPRRVEETLLAELARFRATPPEERELARARRVLLADWAFAHERIHTQALVAGTALAGFDLDEPRRTLAAALAADAGEVQAAARAWLDPERAGVLGWSLP
ncbi:MAG: pitrilysin family protein [Acidobacteriota bacterium]|nr:pitrilysin family protein [Acidobacteriota bacterium]